ncbi:uncharacterized protein LOC110007084 [Amborella trichopoda]|uniref:uncharacterized protein LOC110007084 n=1 Tax=Amborella trichopoda TaxID=13333 RepID=UPI0009C0894A|nr:uncharacterized protein LOC110007084 [Amborella trichopoda]|eukprot:XP_020521702.1 uncharacterized protein LOC110007084 [Amborella trichopoda]
MKWLVGGLPVCRGHLFDLFEESSKLCDSAYVTLNSGQLSYFSLLDSNRQMGIMDCMIVLFGINILGIQHQRWFSFLESKADIWSGDSNGVSLSCCFYQNIVIAFFICNKELVLPLLMFQWEQNEFLTVDLIIFGQIYWVVQLSLIFLNGHVEPLALNSILLASSLPGLI